MDEQSTGSQAVQCQVHAVREDTLLLGGAGEEQYLSIFPTVKLKDYDLQLDPDRN